MEQRLPRGLGGIGKLYPAKGYPKPKVPSSSSKPSVQKFREVTGKFVTKDGQVRIIASNETDVRYTTHTSDHLVVQRTKWHKNEAGRYYFVATFRRNNKVLSSRYIYADEFSGP